MKKININKVKLLVCFIILTSLFCLFATPVYATSNFADSAFFKGTEKLIADVSTGLTALVVGCAVAGIIYFQIRKAIADEMDHKKWDTRTIVAIVSTVVAVSAKVLIDLFVGYYS